MPETDLETLETKIAQALQAMTSRYVAEYGASSFPSKDTQVNYLINRVRGMHHLYPWKAKAEEPVENQPWLSMTSLSDVAAHAMENLRDAYQTMAVEHTNLQANLRGRAASTGKAEHNREWLESLTDPNVVYLTMASDAAMDASFLKRATIFHSGRTKTFWEKDSMG